MNRADALYVAGYRAALAVARAAALKIEGSSMHTLRKEMAAEALRSFADEAEAAMHANENFSPASSTVARP